MKELNKTTIKIGVGVLIALLLFLVANSFAAGQKWNDTQNSISQLTKTTIENREKIDALQTQNVQLQVELASIKARLTSIDSTLQEIKQDLRNK